MENAFSFEWEKKPRNLRAVTKTPSLNRVSFENNKK
jgi:hypothetical protein